MEKLTMQEEEVMIYIWELESCYVKDIVAKFEQPTPPYTTVASIVKNLERKKYVKAQRVGNTYLRMILQQVQVVLFKITELFERSDIDPPVG
ncbi:BlaI/MecI/CopY family transcriptional regulator, partial [Bacteroides fragilis]|uniref:BlaI/MecI/CopY family transcriptional regulator n=1 Tax=Bacteroides fragilis TaxID=817 RepID=UPI000A8A5052